MNTPDDAHPRSDHGLEARVVVDRPAHGDPGFRLDAHLSIRPGETVALLGPNGAGKSTAVAALAGLVAVTAGRICLAGRVLDDPDSDVFVPAPERRVGVVFQEWLLFAHMTVLDNVAFGLRARGRDRRTARQLASTWLERLDVASLAGRRPGDLSGGQAQRVALARALVTDPDMLLLDEPLSALDVATRARARRRLATHLADFAGPRLLITHDPTEAFLLADRVSVLEHGRVSQVGTPDDIRLRPTTPWVADFAGANLLHGHAHDGLVTVDERRLHVADHDVDGPVLVTISPTAVTVHRHRPEGSQRNTWATRIDGIEVLGDRVRVRTAAPAALTVEITRESSDALDLAVGTAVWVAVKATGIDVRHDGGT